MADKGKEFDSISMVFRTATRHTWETVRMLLVFVLIVFSLTVLAYTVFALIFSTDTEKRLKRENRMYEKYVTELMEKEALIGDAIANLQYKDNEIYGNVFHSDAPNVDPMSSLNFLFASDSLPDTRLTSYTRDKSDQLLRQASAVDSIFLKIFTKVGTESFTPPPMTLPLKDINYPQVGASKGSKINPFYKAYVEHEGMDIIVARGTPVYASADGIVASGTGRHKGSGNIVEINHSGGYVTKYKHLDNIFVKAGQTVSRGQKIGTVGMSGNSSAPHLHWEVIRDGEHMDPMGFVFASVGPEEYANMLYMATGTKQSLD